MNDHGPVEGRARELFERASRHLEPALANRLRQSRRKALAPRTRPRRWLPLAAMASVLAIALAWWLPRQRVASVEGDAPVIADTVLTDSDEDKAIYAWLGDAPVAPDQDQGGAL